MAFDCFTWTILVFVFWKIHPQGKEIFIESNNENREKIDCNQPV